MELNEMTVEELKVLQGEVKEALVGARALAKETEAAEKVARAARFKSELNAGDVVSFLYGRENVLSEGTVVRTSEQSATVESDSFSKGKNYVRYDRFVEVLEAAPEVEEVTEATEDADAEEVA
jgi:hypothetical protein